MPHRQSARTLHILLFSFGLIISGVGITAQAQTSPVGPDKGNAARNQTSQPQEAAARDEAQSEAYFEELYRNFRHTYRIGPDDELAIRVQRQPDYTLEKAIVTPDGRVFHPLLGDIEVAGMTVDQLTKHLTSELSEYVLDPKVTVSLLAAKSAKIGVIGEVTRPGILLMSEPMTVLDAITASGGFSNYGNQSKVTLLRKGNKGQRLTITVNLKKVLEGKADTEENLPLQAGDTVIVHGNAKRTMDYITQMAGFANFLTWIGLRR